MELTLDQLNQRDKAAFTRTLGGVFEHAPWVAELAYHDKPFQSLDALHKSMVEAVMAAPAARQLELIRAHPDLAGKTALAGDVTEASKREQAGAGLDTLSEAEYRRFHALNETYKARFGFPFILAVKGHDKTSILQAFEARLEHDAETERQTALEQIARIARFRLEALLA